MLKAVQNLGCSSGFLSQLWKKAHHNTACGFSSIAISTNPLSNSASTRTRRRHPTTTKLDSFISPVFSTRGTRSERPSRVCETRSESNPDATTSPSSSSAGNVSKINFCQWCGGPTKHDIPDGEEKMRAICTVCDKIAYQNPKMYMRYCVTDCIECTMSTSKKDQVVGCLIEHDKKILLCKRNIEPSYGLWTLPAGYMEIGESAADGAIRETWEEAGADVEVESPFAQLDIPLIGQTYVIFLAKMKKPHFSPGPESSECRLFDLDDIPFDSLAFSSIFVSLNLYIDDIRSGKLKFHYGTINKRPGSSPSDMHAFSLDNHLQC